MALTYKLINDNTAYAVTGQRIFEKDEIIPSIYEGLPVVEISSRAFYNKKLTSVTIPSSVTSIGNEAFSYCYSLTSVTIENGENGVTSIGERAFYYCNKLTSITIPEGVTEIGDYAFSYCDSLTSIIIPDSVTTIGRSAFINCTSLTSVTIGNSVTTMGYQAFQGCTSLTSITISEGITSIGSSAFYGCTALTSIIIPSSVTKIGNNAFQNCTLLQSISIEEGVTTIGSSAFGSCTSLESITIPDSVTIIENSAFSNCTSLQSINIGEGVTSIGNLAFHNCEICQLNIPSGVTTVGTGITSGCNKLETIEVASENATYKSINGSLYTKAGNTLIMGIPAQTVQIENNVTTISPYAFSYYSSIETVQLPETLTTIPERAFYECTSLAHIEIPNNVTSIGDYAFYGCSSLTSIEIPSSLTSIGGSAFDYCTSLTSVNYLGTIAQWCNISFSGYSSNPLYNGTKLYLNGELIADLVIPNTVTKIKDYVFEGCTSLTSVTIPDSVTTIGSSAFKYCYRLVEIYNLSSLNITIESSANGYVGYYAKTIHTSLTEPSILETVNDYIFITWEDKYYLIGYTGNDTELTLPENYKDNNYEIYQRAFYGYKSITRVTIPNNITLITNYAFQNCRALTGLTIPSSVTSIGNNAFAGCAALNGVFIPNSVTSIGDYAFQNCTALTSIEISNAVTSIGESAFSGCTTLTTISLPNKLSEIKKSTFAGCKALSNIELSTAIFYIRESAFENCISLETIVIPENIKTLESSVFEGCTNLSHITFNGCPTKIGTGQYPYENKIFSNAGKNVFEAGNDITVTIGKNVKRIPSALFESGDSSANDSYITKVIFEDGSLCTNIEGYAFRYCGRLKTVEFPNTLKTIGYQAFANCKSITTIKLKKVTEIHAGIFKNCTSLQEIDLSESGLTALSEDIFENCTALTEVTLPNCLETIPNEVFNGCTQLESIVIPATVNSISSTSFLGSALKEIIVDDTNENYKSINGNLYTKDESTLLCYACGKIDTSFEIPQGVISIGPKAFSKCDSLTTISLPTSVTSLANNAFYYCEQLKNISVPNSLTTVGASAFYECNALIYNEDETATYLGNAENPYVILKKIKSGVAASIKEYEIKDETTIIYSSAFSNCSAITTIIIPPNLTQIGQYAFQNKTTLMTVEFKDVANSKLNSIDSGAFYGCKELSAITIPNNTKIIGTSAFYNCTKLNTINFNATLMEDLNLGTTEGVFANAGNASDGITVNISNNVTQIPAYLFYTSKSTNTPNITAIKFGAASSCKTIKTYAFYSCPNLTELTLPDSVETIEANALSTYPLLVTLKFPKPLVSSFNTIVSNLADYSSLEYAITDNAKYITNIDGEKIILVKAADQEITSCIIDDSTIIILDQAFKDCDELTQITLGKNITNFNPLIFSQCSKLAAISVKNTNPEYISIDDNLYKKTANSDEVELIQYAPGKTETSFTTSDSLIRINTNAFAGQKSLKKLILSASCTTINPEALQNSSITEIVIQGNLTNESSLSNTPLTAITFATTVTHIPVSICSYCSVLQTINIEEGVTSIGEGAFMECSSIEDLIIPDSVTTVGSMAFYNCANLQTVQMSKNINSLGQGAFSYCDSLAYYEDDNANKYFANSDESVLVLMKVADDYTEYTIADNTRLIASEAFESSYSIYSITLPKTIEKIENNAFYSCHTQQVYYKGTLKDWCNISFGNEYANPLQFNPTFYIDEDTEAAITTVEDPTISAIKAYTFYGWESLKTINLPSLTQIDDSAFYGCTNIDNVTAPKNILSVLPNPENVTQLILTGGTELTNTDLDPYTELTDLSIGKTITTIGTNAFTSCEKLTIIEVDPENEHYMTIDNALYSKDKTILYYAASQNTTMVLPDGLLTVRENAFESCSALTAITIPSSIDTANFLAATPFSNCTKLVMAKFPIEIYEAIPTDKLTTLEISFKESTVIPEEAFKDCTTLEILSISEAFEEIEANAFAGCTNLATLELPTSLTTVSESAFTSCTSIIMAKTPLTFLSNIPKDSLKILEINTAKGTINREDFIPGPIATLLAEESVPEQPAEPTIPDCSSIEKLILSNDIQKISKNTFKDYKNLIEVILPENLVELEESAFENCSSLPEILLPNTLATIGKAAFKGCTALEAIVLPARGPDQIGGSIPRFTIGESVFSGCQSLASVTINETYANYVAIPNFAFEGCTALPEITIPDTITTIGEGALAGCSSLNTLTIPFIGDQEKTTNDDDQYPLGYIFGSVLYEGCTKINQSYYSQPNTLNQETFYYIPDSLREVTVLKGENLLYGAFYDCQNLTKIVLPEELKTIGEVAFYNCCNLESIVIPDNVYLIGKSAFFYCKKLTTIELNNKVKTIDEDAFMGCDKLSTVNYKGTRQNWEAINIKPSIIRGASVDRIEHFDLVLYPFKTVYGLNNKTEYKNSFNYTLENLEKIKADIATTKNIAHNIITPTGDDITCIKNYLKLKARVTTTKKVTLVEESEILNNIYKAIYTNFNARQVDFGEEIPYETIVSVIKNADYRIKEISLEEPELSTCFRLANGDEELVSDPDNTTNRGNKLYNSLARRNILAGKISAFEYDKDFLSEYDKTSYPVKTADGEALYQDVYPISNTTTKPTITTIKSHFNVGVAFKNRDTVKEPDGLVLKENEVIQFRVPNFKTTKTYPAYVNYFIKLNSNKGSEDAIPATFKTLEAFLGEGNRWTELANSERIKSVLDITNSVTFEGDDGEKNFKAALELQRVLFKKSGDTYEATTSYDPTTEYYKLKIDDNIFVALNNWIKEQPSNELKEGTQEHKKLDGIYRSVGVQEKSYGRLIDIDLKKYLPAYKFNVVDSNKQALQNFYVQDTYDKEDIKVKSKEVTPDGFGKDANYQGLPKNGEYQLSEGEYLLINYTDSQKDASGNETKSVINELYETGDIIRANFDLIDSSLYHNNHSYSKRDGFSFGGQQPEGMFTLGAEEQIEIRDVVKVDLNEDNMYLYWTLNSDDPNKETNTFIFNEDYGEGTNNAYTLKEGEHLYYTNSKKQDLVYYGSGTLIVKNDPDMTLVKYSNSGEVSEEEIMTNGLAAAIPWQNYNLSNGQGLAIIENQYISLTEGDIIVKIDNQVPDPEKADWNDWTKVESPVNTVYRFAEDTNNSNLPPIVVTSLNWSVRSRLDFNMSKTVSQPLHSGDSLTITLKQNNGQTNSVTIQSTDSNGNADSAVANLLPASVNANYTCQAATDTLDTTLLTDSGLDLKLKVSLANTPKIADTTSNLLLNNYVNGDTKYTKFDFANLPEAYSASSPAFKLSTSIPENAFGLIALYYIVSENEDTDNGAQIKAKDGDSDIQGLSFFNMNDSAESSKRLKEGLNIIKVESTVKQLEIYADAIKKSTVIFGTLDVVTGINPKLDYRLTQTYAEDNNTAKLTQLLEDFRSMGNIDDFYYNVPIQHSDEIDLNPAIADDLLSSPLAWYDPNNVNRKFVISEIDADYLSTGITLTKASRV